MMQRIVAMDPTYNIRQLETNHDVFAALFNTVSGEQVRWRFQPGKWNLLEIVCHLYDEEREDFRTRLSLVLDDPAQPFPPIDPTGWVLSRNYDAKDFSKTVRDFLEERKKSISWLRGLSHPQWQRAYIHPTFGPLSGELLLTNWVAHDYLHFRQITRVKYDYLAVTSGVKVDYAGNW
jgi:hypothetical protein